MACPLVRGDDPLALASGFSPVQADKPWYNYFVPPSLVQALLSMTDFVLKFAISGEGGISICFTTNLVCRY